MLRGQKVILRAVEEGRLRRHAWTRGRYSDLVWMGILREEWEARQSPA